MLSEVGNAVAGLLPVAAGRGKLAEAAAGYLREVKRRGLAVVVSALQMVLPVFTQVIVDRVLVEHLGAVAHQQGGGHRQAVCTHGRQRGNVPCNAAGPTGVGCVEGHHATGRAAFLRNVFARIVGVAACRQVGSHG
jgi:hypothetical protein